MQIAFFELNVILCTVCIGINTSLLFLNFKSYLKHRAYIEKFSVLLQAFITLGLGFLLLTFLMQLSVLYLITLIVEACAFCVNIFGFIKMIEIGGVERPKKEKYIIIIYLITVISIIAAFYAFNIKIELIEGNLFFGLDTAYLLGVILLLIIPQGYLLAVTIKNFLKVYEKNLRNPFMLFIIGLFFYLASIFAVLAFMYLRILAFSLLIGALIVGVILNIKYPDLLEELNTGFAYQSLYIIRNNGQTLFQKEFAPAVDEIKDIKIINYLIGGFIYAVKSGLQQIMKEEEPGTHLHTMDFGKIKMAFSYGNHVFGVLFSQDVNKVICAKLGNCIREFEQSFQQFLESNQPLNLIEASEISADDKEMNSKISELLGKYFRG